ncbi:MAG: DUF1080 domain-containing protein, partial [Ginsengibacter sp.]
MKKRLLIIPVLALSVTLTAHAQQKKMKHEDTELYTPVPPVVTPGKSYGVPPSDAIILFDGKNLDQWVLVGDTSKPPGWSEPADWIVKKGIMTVKKSSGNIQTRQLFTDYQLHMEWRIPKGIEGEGQSRGNSGLFLASTGKGDDGYEMQILDNYNNSTYTNGQAGSIYKQNAPLVNPNLPPGVWQSYDVIWTAPRFNDDGTLKTPARVTAFFNGVLTQNNFELKGGTVYIGIPSYKKHGPLPIKIQAHGDKSKPISFRNIWV